MADWRINEKYRKPRRTRGTPFHTVRNYYVLGGLAIGGISWYLFELWPNAQRVKRELMGDKFDLPKGFMLKIKHMEMASREPVLDAVLAKAREREYEKITPKIEESWLKKLTKIKPDGIE